MQKRANKAENNLGAFPDWINEKSIQKKEPSSHRAIWEFGSIRKATKAARERFGSVFLIDSITNQYEKEPSSQRAFWERCPY